MNRKVSLQVVLFSLLAEAFLYYAEASSQCDPHYFQCSNGECVYYTKVCDGNDDCGDNSEEHFCNPKNCDPSKFLCLDWNCIESNWFCDSSKDCPDYSDERFCNIHSSVPCPPGWYRCPTGTRCIPFLWMCNGRTECPEISEEVNCGITTVIPPTSIAVTSPTNTAVTSPTNAAVKSPEYTVLKSELKSWLLGSRKPGCRPDRWGPQVHRIAVALHLADNSTFSPGNNTGEEIRYELTMQLHRIGKDRRMSSQELALYIHALLVACMDPRNFYGDDLVGDLRSRVEEGGNYTNPFLILVLCNAGDDMTVRDVERVTAAYDSQHRLFWADSEALASMALSCISSRSGVSVDESTLTDMLQELKRRQFRNGTVDNFRTTALVTQLFGDSWVEQSSKGQLAYQRD
ncbi:Low-density lipoprotein receptor-related protein 2 [Araneus ventricosus]|uniref:Low-density lipoprotein receptor-related protein 2 n=1 Tax=Araneus ventricosus TaxID=182803 RepID=A0A4Y2MHK3_ARAVE|nr:Low-density lipoprotein receptor-related protein 2 [Araneus ventricosus]GBN25863.1 Low-density lipoprotein receptor-related protein 2 [Araneus ventricosus]